MQNLSKNKTFISTILLSLVLALLLTACSNPSKEQDKEIKIAILNYASDDTFINSVNDKLAESLRKRDAELKKIDTELSLSFDTFSANNSQINQNQQVERLVQQDYDVLIVNIVNRTKSAQVIEMAKKWDTPVIFFNREPVPEDLAIWDQAYYVGTAAGKEGRLQGEMLIEDLEADFAAVDKNNDGVIQYVMLEGETGHQDAILRADASVETVKEAGYELEQLASKHADWVISRAYALTNSWIEAYPKDIEVIFSNNDDMAIGAIKAIEDNPNSYYRENPPYIYGIDATPSGLKAVESGKMRGTVVNDGANIAGAMADLAIYLSTDIELESEYLRNMENNKIRIPSRIVNSENIAAEIELSSRVK